MKLNKYRFRALAWLIFCGGLALVLLTQLPHSRINSSVLSLLPNTFSKEVPPELNNAFMQRLDKQIVWLISPGEQNNPQVAESWLTQLKGLPQLGHLSGPMTAQQQQAWGEYYFQHRNGNIDPVTRQRLAQGGDQQTQWIISQLYSAFSGVSGNEIKKDPLMLTRGAQLYLSGQGSHLSLRHGWLTAQDSKGRTWYFLHGEITGQSFDMQQTHQLVNELNQLKADFLKQHPGTEILSRSASFYSDHASQQAKHDMSHLGLATIVGLVLLVIWFFRSIKPLLLCLLSVSIGALAGISCVLLVWHELHLMTLVMGMSIIGISADYTLYYVTDRMAHGAELTPWQSLHKVGKTLLLALLTTVAAYGIMLLAPFPGIRQMAVFSIAGLTASCMTVLCWHPWLCRRLPVRQLPYTMLCLRWLGLWRHQQWLRIGLPICLSLLAVVGISRLQVNDDIAQLQALPPQLVAEEHAITALTEQSSDQKWFLIYGATPEETLQRLEAFIPSLNHAQRQHWLKKWRSVPLNSLKQQAEDLLLLKQAVPKVQRALSQSGVADVDIDLSPMKVTPAQWLSSPASEGWRLLWFTLDNGITGTLIPVEGVTNSAALNHLTENHPGVSWLDRKANFDQLFTTYRHLISGLIVLALSIVIIGALIRLGVKQGVRSVIPSLISLACGLASLAITGQNVTLFSILALNLVLGIGINYTLFFSNPRGTAITSLQAITLAMVTTLLTLGMLAFSSTPAISSFGTVLCSGIFSAWLVSPLAMQDRRKRKKS